jgi:recombination protein RecA
MANIKKEKLTSLETDFFEHMEKEVNSAFKNAIINLDDETLVKRWIPTGSLMLDTIISNSATEGGYPSGRITEIMGLESTGKSLLALEAVRSVQTAGGYALYIDTEHALDATWVGQLGISKNKLNYIDNYSTVEAVFSIMEKVITAISEASAKVKDKPILVIWDSIAATTTEKELEEDYGKPEMAYKARVMSIALRKITPMIAKYGVTFLCLNQLRANIGNLFQKWIAPGGNAMRFYSSLRMELARSKPILAGDSDYVIGYKTVAKTVKNKVGPNKRTCEFDILFNKGVDETTSIFDYLLKVGVIDAITKQKFSLTYGDGLIEEFKRSEWPELYNVNSQVKDFAVLKARQNLVIDLNALDFTKVHANAGNGELIDYEYGQISTSEKPIKGKKISSIEEDAEDKDE